MVDAAAGVLGIEWIDGSSVRFLLGGGAEDEIEVELDVLDPEPESTEAPDHYDALKEYEISQGESASKGNYEPGAYSYGVDELMVLIGTEIAKMHQADIIHGDLTTSNMMLRRTGQLVRRVSLFLPHPDMPNV